MKPAQRTILLACFFTTGATSLTFEVAWSKQLSYLLGNGLHAVSTVVAAFMAGLALGSWLVSRYGDRTALPVAWYGGAQVAVAALGVASIPLFRHAEPLFRWVYHSFDLGHGTFLAVRFLVVFLLMAVPVTLMGVTLPLVVGALARRRDFYSHEAGLLYGVNTLGAVAGTLGSGFLLLPALGLWKTCVAAGLLDATAGGVAILLQRDLRDGGGRSGQCTELPGRATGANSSAPGRQAGRGWTSKQWAVGLLFGLSGAVALVYELGWFRLLGLVMGPSVVAFSSMLGVYLAGIGAGSALAARRVDRFGSSGPGLMGWLEVLLGLAGCGGFFYFNGLPALYAPLFGALSRLAPGAGPWLSHLGIAAAVVLPPCLLMGVLFPAAVRALREAGPRNSPETGVGRLYLLNTMGGIAGSLAAGFWLIPSAGLGATLATAGIASGLLGTAFFALAPWPVPKRVLAGLAGVCGCALLAGASPPIDVPRLNLGNYRGLYATRSRDSSGPEGAKLLFYREGLNAPVAVYNIEGEGSLRVTGKADASTGTLERVTQSLAGHLPVLFAPTARRVAVVGYGSGMSAGAVLAHAGVESADIIEIEGAVIEASPYFACLNRKALEDPRARLILEDARIFLTYTDRTYDVMAVEPSNPWMAGVSNLFTTDFYRIVKSRLAPGGLFCCWIQTYESSPETFGVMLASVREAFPHVALFHNRGDTLLLCSAEPLRVDWETLSERFREPSVAASLRRIGIREPAHLWAYFRASDADLDPVLGGVRVRNTDDNVWLEHHAIRQLLRASASDDALKLNLALANLGADRRLGGFGALSPGMPAERLLREGARFLFSGEPLLVAGDRMVDTWKDVRDALVPGVKAELAAMRLPGQAEAFSAWAEECEAYRKARFDATARLLSSPPQEPGAKYRYLMEVLASAPDLPMANNAVADFLITEGRDYRASEPYYRRAAEEWTSPNCYGARINLGNIALIRSNFEGEDLWEEGEAYYRSAIDWNPFQLRAYLSLAQLHILRGDLGAAERVLDEGLTFNPEAPEIREKQADLRRNTPRRAPSSPGF